jgi:serine/threonine protein kinase
MIHEAKHSLTKPRTDLKPDNILLGIEHRSAIDELVQQESEEPSPYKWDGSRAIYPSRNFGDLKHPPGRPKLADFGLAVSGDVSSPHTHPIQPNLFQAPEVILEAGWSYSADIWNLGVMVSPTLNSGGHY